MHVSAVTSARQKDGEKSKGAVQPDFIGRERARQEREGPKQQRQLAQLNKERGAQEELAKLAQRNFS